MRKSTISMAIFNSYVKLPEGIHGNKPCFFKVGCRRIGGFTINHWEYIKTGD
jgi:hypothetical protein